MKNFSSLVIDKHNTSTPIAIAPVMFCDFIVVLSLVSLSTSLVSFTTLKRFFWGK